MSKLALAKTGAKNEDILLGSGDVYTMDFTGTIPEDAVIETKASQIGAIKGGASLTYNATLYTVIDDMRRIAETIITGEEVIFKTGYLKFALGDLARLSLSSRLSATDAEEVLEIGGALNIKKSLLRFVHTLKNGKKLRVTIVGTPKTGFELAFSPEAESVINAEFNGEPQDEKGTLVKITKEL